MQYDLEKSIWTEQDFDKMGWHDSSVYGIAFGTPYELSFDIDYIFKWVEPFAESDFYSFWVSPCTLVFENLHDLKFDIEISEPFELEINDIVRENPARPRNADFIGREQEFDWTVETHQGIITFKSVGFKQFVRQKPLLLVSQSIPVEKRGSVSFDKVAYK